MSNIRQRRGPSPSRDSLGGGSSTSWDASGDNINTSTKSKSATGIPMYNPLQFQSPSSVYSAVSPPLSISSSATSASTRRISWNTMMDAKKVNTEFIREEDVISKTNYHQHYVATPGSAGLMSAGSCKDIGYNMSQHQSRRSLPPMTPTLVPDSAYRAYVSGQGSNDKKNQSGAVKILVAKCIGYFSLVGFLFLILVGILIDAQPMYLQGIMPKQVRYSSGKSQTYYATDINERLEPATHAYRGAFLYLFTAIVCLGYANNVNWFLFRKRWQQYRDIDDTDSTVPTFHNGANDEFLPGTIHQRAYGEHNGYISRSWHSTSVRCQRFGIYLESFWEARRRNRRRFAGAKDV
jgi:hypothetical protein